MKSCLYVPLPADVSSESFLSCEVWWLYKGGSSIEWSWHMAVEAPCFLIRPYRSEKDEIRSKDSNYKVRTVSGIRNPG